MLGDWKKDKFISGYQPNNEIIKLTAYVKKDYNQGVEIINKPYVELNDRSVIADENNGQAMFNAYVDISIDNPDEDWKWRGTGSNARNKALAMHANLTSGFLIPQFLAQNEDDEVDRGFSEIMQDLVEWMAQPTNSDYQQSFLQVVFGMLYNPVTFMGAEYYEVMQTIKKKSDSGDYSKEEIMDEVLSGFKAPVFSSSEILINNAYERNIQKQKCIIERKYTTYEEMEAKYGDHENWPYVQKGIKSIYSEEEGLFYDVKEDDDHSDLVAEEIVKYRREDLEVPFVNGIFMGDVDAVETGNRIKHRDQNDAPKYNKIPFGYSRIGEHFFYYKSMMNVLQWDNMRYDAMDEIIMNRALLETEMPLAVSGGDKVDSEVIFPNSIVSFEDPNTKVQPLIPNSNTPLAFNELRTSKESIEEASVSSTLSGQLPEASQKAYNVAQARADAKKLIGGVGKLLAQSMIQYGDLMKDIVLNNLTVADLKGVISPNQALHYKSFLLENKEAGGKMGDKIIRFDERLIGMDVTEEEKMAMQMELLEESGWPDKTKSISLVNPELFAKYKYLTKMDVAEMFNKNHEFMQAKLENLRAQLANDPYISMEELDRRLMYAHFQSDGENLMKKPEEAQAALPNMAGMAAANNNRIQNQQVNTATNVVA